MASLGLMPQFRAICTISKRFLSQITAKRVQQSNCSAPILLIISRQDNYISLEAILILLASKEAKSTLLLEVKFSAWISLSKTLWTIVLKTEFSVSIRKPFKLKPLKSHNLANFMPRIKTIKFINKAKCRTASYLVNKKKQRLCQRPQQDKILQDRSLWVMLRRL